MEGWAAVSSELKACPFCGGAARQGSRYVHCQRCHAETASIPLSSDAVAANWNRRSPSPAVLALVEALKSLRRSHYINEGDPWYSCPAATGDYACSNDNAAPGCNCGADDDNRRIDEALAAVERETKEQQP